ncbi:hypothetical protein GCM10025787_26620 [Saccharopolyspora rosea]
MFHKRRQPLSLSVSGLAARTAAGSQRSSREDSPDAVHGGIHESGLPELVWLWRVSASLGGGGRVRGGPLRFRSRHRHAQHFRNTP